MKLCWPAVIHLPQGPVVVVSTISAAQGSLYPEEEKLLTDTTPARRREIVAGRRMAHQAMFELSINPVAVLFDHRAAPEWPTGLCGSISHSPTHVAVAMARTDKIRGLGIDIEDGRDLGAIRSDIASESDIAAVLAQHFPSDTVTAVRFAFSAKEALFKCQAPITDNQSLDFSDVGLVADPNGTLSGRGLHTPVISVHTSCTGRRLRS